MIYIQYIILIGFVMLFQSVFPVIYLQSYRISPDFLLIFLTFYALRNNRFTSVFIGFFIGFLQDFLSNVDLIGAFSFIKTIIGFMVASIRPYLNFFSKKIILSIISVVYIINFTIFYLLRFNNSVFDILLITKIICINFLINILMFILLNKIFFDSEFIKK